MKPNRSVKLVFAVSLLFLGSGCILGDRTSEIFVENGTIGDIKVRLEERGASPQEWVDAPKGTKVNVGCSFNPENSGAVLRFRADKLEWSEPVDERYRNGDSYVLAVSIPKVEGFSEK